MFILKSLKIVNIISFKEQVFEFKNNKAILIVGQNLDDSSQNGNGSGKSSLIEAISVGFTGTSLRDVKTKELIHEGAESGEVILTLSNTTTGKDFIIWRKLHANSKSAEYGAWIDGKEQCDRYSDLNGFNAFVWETIGISKEDFFSFFLITKENYLPFLLVGDTKKKEIINRFSGADKVELAMPEIEKDSEAIAQQIYELDKELTANQTRQQVIVEQLQEEKDKNGEEAKNEVIKIKQSTISVIEEKVALIEEAIIQDQCAVQVANEAVVGFDSTKDAILIPFNEAIELAELELLDFESETDTKLQPYREQVNIAQLQVDSFQFTKDYDREQSVIMADRILINRNITEKKLSIPKVKEQFSAEITELQKEEQELRETIKETEKEISDNEAFESQINKQLQDSIECPSCSHKFSLRDKTFNYTEAVAKLPEVQETIKELLLILSDLKVSLNDDIQTKKEAVNAKILAAGEVIKNEIQVLNNELVELGTKELALKAEQQKELEKKRVLEDDVTAKARLLKIQLHEITHQKTNLESVFTQAKKSLENKEFEVNTTLQQFKNNVRRAELNLKQKEADLQAHKEQIISIQQQIEKLRNEAVDDTKIKELQTKIENLVKLEEEIKVKLEAKRKEKESVDSWEIHFKNFKGHLANKCLNNIEQYTNLFLQNMGSNLTISIEGYRTLASKKLKEQINTSVKRDGFDAGSYGRFSGGERSRVDIAAILSLQELILLNAGHGKGLDMLLVDEVMESVDVSGMECIIGSLQSLEKTIMLVSQHTEISSLSEHTLTIQKKNKVSTILN